MSRWSRSRWQAAALVALGAGAALGAEALPAGASGVSAKVSPNHGLVNGQVVTVSGHGLTRSYDGTAETWFAAECTAAVHGRMSTDADTPHCNITDAQGIRVARNGSFATRFHVRTGIIGDGYCGTVGHPSCVIGIGTAQGLGTVVKITFASPAHSGAAG